jgi:GWxTD domain-containing protein
MKKIGLMLSIIILFSGCTFLKNEIKASKAKKHLTNSEMKAYYLLSLFGKHSETKSYLLKPTKDERETYLRNFWKMYTPDLKSSRNSFYVEILKRYSYSKLKFRYMRTSGEKTDMGRMYIKYGPPVEIQRNPTDVERRDYQEVIVWEYDTPRRFRIGFRDENGTGSYQIIPGFDAFPDVCGKDYRYYSLKEVENYRNN